MEGTMLYCRRCGRTTVHTVKPLGRLTITTCTSCGHADHREAAVVKRPR